MKNLFLSIFVLLFATVFTVNAQKDVKTTSVDEVNNVAITFVKETHNFGTIEEGPKATYDFEFTNTGTEPLIITNCKASCGCTVIKCPKEPIMPGETGTIKATYNTKGRKGGFTKTVTVNSNAATPRVTLYIKGKVEPKPVDPTTPIKPPDMLKEDSRPGK
ncbi:MAG: DUF1573 domain-containing protein [Bacteroidetes bacterium]|nr:DUF1573 domain-containing protein [Bacteroidota bacterium]